MKKVKNLKTIIKAYKLYNHNDYLKNKLSIRLYDILHNKAIDKMIRTLLVDLLKDNHFEKVEFLIDYIFQC